MIDMFLWADQLNRLLNIAIEKYLIETDQSK